MNESKLNFSIYFIFSIIIVSLFLYYNLIYFYIDPIIYENQIITFGDWRLIPDSIICKSNGFNVFLENQCDVSGRSYPYGKILLYLPFEENFYFFYTFILPIFLVFIFIYIIHFLLDVYNSKKFILSLLIIFSVPSMLLIERANLEILIFILIFFISLINKDSILHVLICLVTHIKFYPAVSSVIFFISDQKAKLIKNIVISFLLVASVIFFNFEELKMIFGRKDIINPNTIENSGIIIYSFYALADLIVVSIDELYSVNLHKLKYFIYIFQLGFYVFFINYFIKKLNSKKFLINLTSYSFENKLLLISGSLLVTIFFLNWNYSYKEIYFLGLIPFLINNFSIKLCRLFYYLIFIKFVFGTILIIVNKVFYENSLIFKGFNILFKNLIDNILVIFLLSIFIIFLRQINNNLKLYNILQKKN